MNYKIIPASIALHEGGYVAIFYIQKFNGKITLEKKINLNRTLESLNEANKFAEAAGNIWAASKDGIAFLSNTDQ